MKWFGFTDSRFVLQKIYRLVDDTIFCSENGNLPNVVFEPMTVRIPVLGISSDGIPELINSENGILAKKATLKHYFLI